MFFPCAKCGSQAFLVGTMCATCDPMRHADYQRNIETAGRRMDAFKAETGHDAFKDWKGFEKWLESGGWMA